MARVYSGYKILDYINNFSHDWSGYSKIKIMKNTSNIFLKKKILIYGLGKSGLSTLKFLQNKCEIYIYDDFIKKIKFSKIKKK